MKRLGITTAPNGDRFRAGRRLWSEAEETTLREGYPDLPTVAIARQLRRSVAAVYQRVRVLGLYKSAAYLSSPAAGRTNGRQGLRTRFPKRHVPANKGLRRPGWAPGRMKETQFKPGQRSGTAAQLYMPVGSTRLIEGYLYRKVADVSKVAYTVNWKPEHHLIWTAAHGPLPRGHVLIFRDGNQAHVTLDNLECIDRCALMLRNSVHNLPKPLAQAAQLLGALNRQIRRRTPHAE